MKKLIVLIMVSLFVSPVSAKILGIEFNEKLSENHSYTKVEGEIYNYTAKKSKNLQVFDSFNMNVDDSGTVNMIEFIKTYNVTFSSLMHDKNEILKEFKSILLSLENKYGEFDKTGCDRILSTVGKMNGFYISKFKEMAVLNPVNNEIGVISLYVSGLKELDPENGKKIKIHLIYINDEKYQQILKDRKKYDF